MQYNGTMYRYVHNLQGDILAILDSAGNTVVQYAYDAWGGKKTTTGSMAGTLGYLNPFRYRGYVWDEETWMYYLRSRYYYPELQRFIGADALLGKIGKLLAHNLFFYGNNNPVVMVDNHGNSSQVSYKPLSAIGLEIPMGPLTKMTNLEFVAYLRQMADENWTYKYGNASYKSVDCVGAYKHIMKWYYDYNSFIKLLGVYDKGKKKIWPLTTVDLLVKHGTYGVTDLTSYDDLLPGTAVFRQNKSGKWMHVGFYIGITSEYGHTVVEAKDEEHGVIYSPLEGSTFTHYGELTGVEYLSPYYWR